MARRNRGPMSILDQFAFMGRYFWASVGISMVAIFLVWKQVESSSLRTRLFGLENECTSLLAQNEQLMATRMSLSSFSVIRSQAERELGMVMPACDPDWIVVSAGDVTRGGSRLRKDNNTRESEPYDDPGGTVACIR